MATTFVKIATVTVGAGGSAAMEFTSIVGTYTDLLVKYSTRTNRTSAAVDEVLISFNGATTNFSNRYLWGDGASASSGSGSSLAAIYGATTSDDNNTASVFGNGELYIPNYAGSSNKSVSIDSVAETNGTTTIASLVAGLWSNTAAITSVKLTPRVGTLFNQYSTATLYGISKS